MESAKAWVYWLHWPEHSDPKTQGYVGVTTDLRSRLKLHKAHGYSQNETFIKVFDPNKEIKVDVLLEADSETCYAKERELRPERHIGWNVNKGSYGHPRKRCPTCGTLLSTFAKIENGKCSKDRPPTIQP